MTSEDLRVPNPPHVILHGGCDAAKLWTDLRLAQPSIPKVREVLITICEYFIHLVIQFIKNRSPGIRIVPLIVMRGGAFFLNLLWRDLPGCQIGLIWPMRTGKLQDAEIIAAELPPVADAHLVVFDLIANSGDTIERVVRHLREEGQSMALEPLSVQVASPFSTVRAASRIKEGAPGVVFHTIWNGLERRSNGWLTGIDFDAGDIAFGMNERFRTMMGRHIEAPMQRQPSHAFNKIAALIRTGERILVVRKNLPGRGEFIMPGGKPQSGESQEETLRRELAEELGVTIAGIKWFGWFEDRATFENVPIAMDVYEVGLQNSPKPLSEIVELEWIGTDHQKDDLPVGNLLKNGVLPALRKAQRT